VRAANYVTSVSACATTAQRSVKSTPGTISATYPTAVPRVATISATRHPLGSDIAWEARLVSGFPGTNEERAAQRRRFAEKHRETLRRLGK
jgi:hypothetical protein